MALPKLTFANHTLSLGSNAGEYSVTANPAIADAQNLSTVLATKVDSSTYTTGLASKANASDVQTAVPANALFTVTMSQIYYNGNYLPGNLVTFPNSQISLGANSGQISVIAQPSIAEVQSGALTSQLSNKATQSDLLSINDGSGFAHL